MPRSSLISTNCSHIEGTKLIGEPIRAETVDLENSEHILENQGNKTADSTEFGRICRALYLRSKPYKNQKAFLDGLFKSIGGTYFLEKKYAEKIVSGREPLSYEIKDSIPNPIDKMGFISFARDCFQKRTQNGKPIDAECTRAARELGIASEITIEPEPFLAALADYTNAAIHDPDNCSILRAAYFRHHEGEDVGSDPRPFSPRYQRDNVAVMQPPAQQHYRAAFRETFSHEWVLQNNGNQPWHGRILVCTNPKDYGVRPVQSTTIDIPTTQPSLRDFVHLTMEFETRGREGKAISTWEMHDAEGNNCFPNIRSIFNVQVEVTNPDAPSREAGR